MIKVILQRAGISLMQLANVLSISRPTLDSYISAFDNGQKLANSFYQDIFEFLFEDADIDSDEFQKRYTYMRDQYGMTEASAKPAISKLKSGYSMPKGEYERILDDIVKHIESDRVSPETPKEIYTLLLFSLDSMAPEYLDLVRFYSCYAGLKNVDALSDEKKKRYTVFFKMLRQIDDLTQEVTDDEVAAFVKYASRKDEVKKMKLQQIKTTIADNLSQLVESKIETDGLDSIDIDKIIKTIETELKGTTEND